MDVVGHAKVSNRMPEGAPTTIGINGISTLCARQLIHYESSKYELAFAFKGAGHCIDTM